MITKRTLTIGLGLVAMILAANFAGEYTPHQFNPDSRCHYFPEDCPLPDPATAETALAALWWVVGVGFVAVLVGLLLPRQLARPEPAHKPAPVAVHAAVVGLAGAGVLAVGVVVLFIGATSGNRHALLTILCVLWLIEIGLINAIDRWLGAERRVQRAAVLIALFAFLAVAAVFSFVQAIGLLFGNVGSWALLLLHGGCLAVGVLTVRRGPVAGLVGLALLGLVVAGLLAGLPSGVTG